MGVSVLVLGTSCAANPIDAGLNEVENSVIALEHEIHDLSDKPALAQESSQKLEDNATNLRKAYSLVVKTDTAIMSKDQEARWIQLRKRSIDAIANMMNLIAKAQPN